MYPLAGGPRTAEGSFHGTTSTGERVFMRIPVVSHLVAGDPEAWEYLTARLHVPHGTKAWLL